MNILSIAYPFAPVGPRAVGGAEQILTDLDRALVGEGHRSFVIACEGSETAGDLFSVHMPLGELDAMRRAAHREQVQEAIDRALASHRIDLIHLHGLNFGDYTLPADTPVVATLHMPLSWYPEGSLHGRFAAYRFVCVSESQRRTWPSELQAPLVIENGVDIPRGGFARKGNFALALGRICPEKNLHEALAAGTLANVPVYIGGQVFPYPEHETYFTQIVEPLLRASQPPARHAFLGVLPPERKHALLAEACCLLHPTLAPETSSLVAMEALAAGTPVIAYRSGALPEIVEEGVTGFLVHNVEEMAEAIRNVHTLSPAACRDAAERRFAKACMIHRYFDLYAELIDPMDGKSRQHDA